MADNDAALLSWLATSDAKCPVCSYSLRGLRQARCPECSAPLHLAVGSSHFVTGPWVLAMVSFALAMGFDGVVVVLMTVAMTVGLLTENTPPAPGLLSALLLVLGGFCLLAAICGLGVWFLIRRKKVWLRQEPRRQWRVAAAVFVCVGLVHLAYAWVVMMIMDPWFV